MSDLKRKEFESWFLINAKWYGNRDCLEFDGEEYSDGSVQLAFDAWQASREFLVIELPIPVDFPDGTGDYHQMIDPDDLIDAIHADGVKTK